MNVTSWEDPELGKVIHFGDPWPSMNPTFYHCDDCRQALLHGRDGLWKSVLHGDGKQARIVTSKTRSEALRICRKHVLKKKGPPVRKDDFFRNHVATP